MSAEAVKVIARSAELGSRAPLARGERVHSSMAEQIFLHERDVYVSNTRVVLHGTTYSTANITSLRTRITPPSVVYGVVLAIIGGTSR